MENIIEIRNGDFSARINLSRGANCICLKNEKHKASLLREPDYEKGLDNPYLYGMPILYPANRIEGGKFTFEGREYRFPINEKETGCHLHGDIHNAPFQLLDQGEDFVKCGLEKAARDGFDHAFRIEITYKLREDGLFQKTEIFNLSDENMPSFLAFHTTFNAPFIEGSDPKNILVRAEVEDLIERNMENFLPTGNILPEDEITKDFNCGTFSPFTHKISRHYKTSGSGKMVILDKEKRLKIVYENSENFPFRLIYNGSGEGFICLEPMTSMANCPNSPFDRAFAGFDFIPPKKKKTYLSILRLEEF